MQVFVVAPPFKCREWHAARPETDRYRTETFDNMIQRFEEPSSMARWDSPLFTIAWDDTKQQIPMDALWAAITTGEKKGPTAAVNTVGPSPWL